MNLQFYIIFIIYAISTNLISTQDFFKAQLSPSAFTFVPYLDGEVTVYEHIQNGSRLFVPPLAVLYLNQTRVFYNRLSGKYLLRLSLILYTNELRTTILKYVSHTRNRCSPPQEICDIKMVPTERLRVVWKRTNKMSSDYNLDTSWQSNTALLNKIDVHIECTTNQTCDDLLNDVLETPDILNGLELEYSTQTEKQARKIVTITGQHVMKTQMYSQLKQLPSSTTESSVRYLLVDDMNQLLTEILTTMELEEITDSGYITQDDQKTLTDLLRQRLSLNVEILHGHMERQWNSVYWNSDNIRPDRIVNLLNDELEHLRNKTILTHQNQTSVEQQQHQKQIDEGSAHASYDTSENLSNSNRNKTDRLNDRAGSNSTGQKLIDQNSRDQSHGHSYQDSSSNSRYRDRSSSSSTDAKATFAGFGAGVSLSKSNSHIDGDSSSRSHYGSNDWRNAMSKYSDRSQEGSNAWKDTQGTGDDLSGYNATAWRHAANQNQQTAHDHSSTEEDAQSFQELRHQNFDFYKNNRQFIEFTGEKFIVKPVKAYKLNLATFQENTKFVHRSIVVSHIDLIHAVPIRILSLSSNALLAPVPVIDNYTNVFELKLRELNEELTVTKLALANVKLSLSTIENNTEKSKLHTTIHLTELKSSVTTNKNNVDELKLHTTSQLTELKSLLTAVEHNVDELKLHTTSQLTELKSSATAADNKLSALLTTQAEKDKGESEFKLNTLIVAER
ncbi:unnamed protein product [Rotaria socialis]|uniref:Uncharacterized protein n=1 Tax=Rotaria socialis TaxID=392032 RepID=A0A820SG35_9BILA|nr:unnamed protein product [Rotaria socialis]